MITSVILALIGLISAISFFISVFPSTLCPDDLKLAAVVSSSVRVALTQLLFFYIFCWIIDCLIGLRSLDYAASGRAHGLLLRNPLTWVGRQFVRCQEAIVYRFNSCHDNLERVSTKTLIEPPEPDAENHENFFEKILLELDNSFKPFCCGVIFQEKAGMPLTVLVRGIPAQRFRDRISAFFACWFGHGLNSCLGLIDTLAHDFRFEEIADFGVRYLLSSEFEKNGQRGIIMLGFATERQPGLSILDDLKQYCKTLERDVATFASIQQLKSEVNQAQRVSEARSEFLTQISHDIKSPLNNVKAILSLLREDVAGTADSEKLVITALRNCDSAAELVGSLVDFARHRAGKLSANRGCFDLIRLVKELVQNFEPLANTKGLSLVFASSDTEANCFADRTQISRVLNNIIGNSIKYTVAGKITVGVHGKDEQAWAIRISDTGPGFSDLQLKELFTPFTRFDAQGVDGAGIGLAVSKILTELNSGALMVRSVEGAGAVFTLTLPVANKISQQKAAGNDKIVDFRTAMGNLNRTNAGRQLENLCILVVDDDPESAQALSRILVKEGAEIAQAFTVPDAMSIINFDRPDILITDSKMPDGGGIRLIKYARLNMPETAVVVLTGDASNANELIALGASCVMDKPVHIGELVEYLEDIVRLSARPQALGA